MTHLVVILSLVMILMPDQSILCPKFLECSATCENLDGLVKNKTLAIGLLKPSMNAMQSSAQLHVFC